MPTTPLQVSRMAPAVLAAIVLCAGCTPGDRTPERQSSSRTIRAEEPPGKDPEPLDGTFQAVAPLQDDQRSQLGLPSSGSEVGAASLPPLSAEQWANPAAVSARLVVLQTNYRSGEDSADVRARWSPYLVERMAEDLAAADGGAAPLEELRAKDAVLVGDVVGLTVVERSSSRASVAVTVRRSVVSDGSAVRPARIDLWLVEVVLDPATGHWLVGAVER